MKDSTYVLGIHGHDADSLPEEETVLTEEETVLPADSAFLSGTLHLPHGTDEAAQDRTAVQDHNLVQDTIIALMAVIFILYIRNAVSILPMIAGCLLRWKENLNIEYNVKTSRSRNILALILFPTFCVMLSRYGVWRLPFMEMTSEAVRLIIIAAALGLFAAARILMAAIMKPSRMNHKLWKAGNDSFYTYFAAAALTVIAVAGIMGIADCSGDTIRQTIIYICIFFWLVFIVRKIQIFKNSCSLFSAILYLCTLEILPMALLVLPAVLQR